MTAHPIEIMVAWDEYEALLADAERFRWLDAHALTVDMVADPDNFVQIWHETVNGHPVSGKTLREAVDRARGEA